MSAKPKKGGILPLSKTLLESSVWQQGPLAVQLWIWMLMTAVFAEEGLTLRNGTYLKRGQLWTTYRLMSKALRYRWARGHRAPPIATLKRIIDGWLVERQVELLVERSGMVVTLVKYELYNNVKIIGGTLGGTIGKSLVVQEEDTTQKEEDKTHAGIMYPPEVGTALKIWTDLAPLPTTASTEKSLQVIEAMFRLDQVSWPRIYAICEHAARAWVPAGFIASPAKLRKPTRSGEMKTWEAIERQLTTTSTQVGSRNGYPGKESPADTARALRNAAESLFNDGLLVVGGGADQNLLPESNHTRQGRSGRTPVLPASVDGEMRKDV